VGFDAANYRIRNVVKRRYRHVKQWRDLATRYDKLAIVYRGRCDPQRRHRLDAAIVRHTLAAWRPSYVAFPSMIRCTTAVSKSPQPRATVAVKICFRTSTC